MDSPPSPPPSPDSQAPEPSCRETLLSVFEETLEAQLAAVRKLQGKPSPLLRRPRAPQQRKRGMSHINMAFDILAQSPAPLHVSRLIAAIEGRFGLCIDSESLVSALSKRVARRDRFTRPAPNTFGLIAALGDHGEQGARQQGDLPPASKQKTSTRKPPSDDDPEKP